MTHLAPFRVVQEHEEEEDRRHAASKRHGEHEHKLQQRWMQREQQREQREEEREKTEDQKRRAKRRAEAGRKKSREADKKARRRKRLEEYRSARNAWQQIADPIKRAEAEKDWRVNAEATRKAEADARTKARAAAHNARVTAEDEEVCCVLLYYCTSFDIAVFSCPTARQVQAEATDRPPAT